MALITRANPSWDNQTPYPSYASNSTSGFTPEVWSGSLVEQLYAVTVFGDISNTDYAGEIKAHGDTIKIRTVPKISVSDYEVGAGLTYEVPTNPLIDLQIDVAKSFSFQVNDIDKAQSDLDLMATFSADGAEQMKIQNDSEHLSKLMGQAHADNIGATAGVLSGDINLGVTTSPFAATSANIVEYIINHMLCLDEQNAPESGRWMILPAWACARIKTSELKDASVTGDSISPMRNGRVGMIDRCTIYSSNLLPNATHASLTTGEFAVFSGHKSGLAFASQITKTESLPNPSDFGHLVRGLQVSGSKVVKSELITQGVIAKS